MSAPVRVLVADDHPPTRAGVRRALEEHGFEVCAEAESAPAAVEAALRERPAVCVLDIHMPGGGIAAAGEIVRRLPGTSVVMLTVSRDDADLFDALQAGAVGYLLKDIKRGDLPGALRSVLAGEGQLPPSLVARVIAELRGREKRRRLVLARGPRVELSPREWDVLELLHAGLSTAEIAARLYVEEGTVRSHVSRILAKLRVESRDEALRLLDER